MPLAGSRWRTCSAVRAPTETPRAAGGGAVVAPPGQPARRVALEAVQRRARADVDAGAVGGDGDLLAPGLDVGELGEGAGRGVVGEGDRACGPRRVDVAP